MNDDQLKEAWQKLALDRGKISFQSPSSQMSMEQEINKFERRVNARDRREIITATCFLLLFIVLAISSDGYQRTGAILLSGYFLWIIYYLTKAKMQKPSFNIFKSIKEQLIEYRSYVLLQRNLIKNVLYWYLLPIVPGALFIYSSMNSKLGIVIGGVISFSAFVYVYRLNQRAAKKNYDPLLKELDRAIQNLEV